MTNFDFLLEEKKFASFAEVAVTAEKLLNTDTALAVVNCRRAMEFAVKWMYSVDGDLVMPYQDNLDSLIKTEEFRQLVDVNILRRMDFIRRTANNVMHSSKPVNRDVACLCVENLFYFLDLVAYYYQDNYTEHDYDKQLLNTLDSKVEVSSVDVDLNKLMEENKQLREQLTAQRKEQQPQYNTKPLELSEYETRKLYIDTFLADCGWTEGKDWYNEFPLRGMPNSMGEGFADYVLFGDDGLPLAVIEAKRTCVDIARGRQQAKLYADCLEKQYGQRPVIFLSNGFETTIWEDRYYNERSVASFYSKRDLQKLFNLRRSRTSIDNVQVDKNIAGRYYQKAAVKAVCEAFGKQNRRKALLVMATGSGKTRTVISLCDILLKHGWVKNILFLADRTSLVEQAKRSFTNLLPDLSNCNLCNDRSNSTAHCVFATYQTMINCIDTVMDEGQKLFTCGHFDLVICDEAHRSIYNKYKDIFSYFDAPLVGLTATPKDEIDKNTYDNFDLESGVPTYGYELSQAVKDGYLVDFVSMETKLKFITNGIVYDELSDDEKQQYEATFTDEDGHLPERIESSALNEWVFNENTIKHVINILFKNGLRVDYGENLGKTIIFAKNHNHAEKILEVFNREYPSLIGYAKVIDNYMTYAQSAIDEFSVGDKLPRIAISVDMLDTGIDIPEVLNLVFFKKVMSKAKFWQMIGRGTRLCKGLIDGQDKSKFYIFDFCGNFEFFRMNNSKPTANQLALQSAIFFLKAQIVYKLQDLQYQTQYLAEFRKQLVDDLLAKVTELNRDNFAVRQHLRYVVKYSTADSYNGITYEDTLIMREELAPLILPDGDLPSAVRFDALVHGIELAYLMGKNYNRARKDLRRRVSAVASVANIPEIMMKSELISKILTTDYLDNAEINDFEYIRMQLRDLMKYIPPSDEQYTTNFTDDILAVEWNESELDNDDLKNYREKAEYYIRQHTDNVVISKLKTNVPLTKDDVEQLEKILWQDIGSKQDYIREYGNKPLGEFVRGIVGLDMNVAKQAFSAFLAKYNLNDRQIYFVNQIIEYIVHNGMLDDFSVLQESPFTDKGSIVEIFDISMWQVIRSVIENINANAAVG